MTVADQSATQELDQLYNASRAVRRKHEGQWLLNLSFYDSNQWVAYDGRKVFEPQLEAWRVKLVDNRIRGIVGSKVAKMTKTRPQWVGVPVSTDDQAIAAARLSERGLDYEWGELDLSRKLRHALLWAGTTTAGFWKIWWDSAQGDATEILVYASGHEQEGQAVKMQGGGVYRADQLPTLPADMAEMVTPKRVAMGDVRVDLRNPFEMYPDPLAGEEGLESAEWIIEEAVYSRRFLEERFGEKAKQIKDDTSPTAGIEARLPGMSSSLLQETGAPGYRGARVREYWCKPCSEHPQGKRTVWSQETVLYEGDNPYPWLPYVMFAGIPVPGRFWPSSVTTDLISPQTELNKRRSQIAENAERFGNPAIMRSSVNVDVEWHGLPGEELVFEDYGQNSAPSFLVPPEMPGYVQTDVDRNENSLREVSGQHEVSSGQVPTGVTAASAINLLQEQDDTRLGPDIGDMEQAIAGAGRRILYLMAKFFDDKRTLRIAGADSDWDIQAFKGVELNGYQDIQVQSGSGLPQSKAAKQAAIRDTLQMFVQNGIAVDERSLRKVLREYEIGGLEAFFAGVDRDERQITDEHRRLMNGETLEINSYDNDDLHVQGHEDFQKTSRYRMQSDDIKQNTEEHVAAHRQRQAQNQLAQASQQPAQVQPPQDVTSQPLLGPGPQAGNGASPSPVLSAG